MSAIIYVTLGGDGHDIGEYLSAFDTTDQTAPLTTASYPITCNTIDISKGISIVDGSKVTFSRGGEYNIQFSIQFRNTDTHSFETSVWLSKNGSIVDYTNSITTIPSSHGGIPGATITTVNFVQRFAEGDYAQLMWQSTGDGFISMDTIAAATNPDRPASPSVILTVWRIMP